MLLPLFGINLLIKVLIRTTFCLYYCVLYHLLCFFITLFLMYLILLLHESYNFLKSPIFAFYLLLHLLVLLPQLFINFDSPVDTPNVSLATFWMVSAIFDPYLICIISLTWVAPQIDLTWQGCGHIPFKSTPHDRLPKFNLLLTNFLSHSKHQH